jgi:hypothetical protein
MMPRLFPMNLPDIQATILGTVFLGSNDSSAAGTPLHVPLNEYRDNLRDILGYLRAVFPRIKLVLITPSVVDTERWPTRTTERFGEYADVVRQLGSELSIPVADLAQEPHRITPNDLCDGLHMASSGNRKIFEAVSGVIRTHYPELVPGDIHEAPLTSVKNGTADEQSNVLSTMVVNTNPGMPLHYPDRLELGGKNERESKEFLDAWRWSSKL